MKNNKYYLIDRENNFREYKSFEHLVSCLGKEFLRYVGNSFNDTYTTWTHYYHNPYHIYERIGVDYIVMDSLNRVIQTRIIKEAIEKSVKPERKYWSRLDRSKNYLGFRNGPVPFIGKRGYGKYYRHPKTKQAIVESVYDKKYIRKKRGRRQLPTSWDDVCRSDYNNRSWKKFRKTQYK